VIYQPLPIDDPKRRRPDIAKAERLLGWSPKTSLEQGLRATIAWFEEGVARRGVHGERGDEALLTV